MYELNEKIEQLRLVIDRYVCMLIGQKTTSMGSMLSALSRELSNVFPEIVGSYELPEMADCWEDRQYWIGQLQRIMDAFSKEDRFLAIDVLFFETKVNLEEYQRILAAKGLI